MYYVYILSNNYNTVLYIGVTNDIERRVREHKSLLIPWFTQRYNITKLVYYEESSSVNDAIAREKQLKWRSKIKKVNLVKESNPKFEDISLDYLWDPSTPLHSGQDDAK